MRIILHKNFNKKYKKLRLNEKKKFKGRRNLFLKNPFHPTLNNHPLHGKYVGYRSIGITGDLRVIYELLNKNTAFFVDMDIHSNLYS
ncbi:type II toxin-antitoxin system mRNA interferase toxin, RelE/StbE family [Patescibacteria group bacterium]|nr:type II toxin-antitoxin system mRNA interferase toxin, RelE/StbE family [Patescibacteria group bacterium]MBU2633582.1 type II toxin-antitoxin system mRNA interferase toxin, RelE/StbE family [Patescibacteria group bacterium]